MKKLFFLTFALATVSSVTFADSRMMDQTTCKASVLNKTLTLGYYNLNPLDGFIIRDADRRIDGSYVNFDGQPELGEIFTLSQAALVFRIQATRQILANKSSRQYEPAYKACTETYSGKSAIFVTVDSVSSKIEAAYGIKKGMNLKLICNESAVRSYVSNSKLECEAN